MFSDNTGPNYIFQDNINYIVNNNNNCADSKDLRNLLDSNVVKNISNLINQIANNDYASVDNYLTDDQLQAMAVSLAQLQTATSPSVATVTSNFTNLLSFINDNVTNHIKNESCAQTIATLQESINDLSSRIKIQDAARGAIPSTTVIAPLLTLKPEYAMYVQKYGMPVNGKWDLQKLGQILLKMNNGK